MLWKATTALLLLACGIDAAIPACPAGMPLGNLQLTVRRSSDTPALPFNAINRLEEGDSVLYSPDLRRNEKREGKVAIVLVGAIPQPDQKHGFTILQPKPAGQPGEWKIPSRASLAVFVYGPDGLSTRKLRGFLARDEELLAQLADYAERTAQTEVLLQALSTYETAGASENLGAALQGFSSQFGLNNKIDRNAPLDQQTLAVFRSLNPALSSYDPITPPGAQRVSQTTGLATAVAGMFFGSTVGVAAGGTAMALNLKTILFPNTEFRSSYAQPVSPTAISLCGRREGSQGRTRLAYLWALRLPDSGPPAIRIDGPNNIPAGLRTPVPVKMPEPQWKLAGRAHGWSLLAEDGTSRPVAVTPAADSRSLLLDLSQRSVPPGRYVLHARWDWDEFLVSGELFVRHLSSLENVRPLPESQNRLRHRNGKQVIQLAGDDFQFVEKVELIRTGDKYGRPAVVPFSLPSGLRSGPQYSLEMQVDTALLEPGRYSLLLYQSDGKPRASNVEILDDPPVIESLPLTLNEGDRTATVLLRGRDLHRITKIDAEGFVFHLSDAHQNGRERAVRIEVSPAEFQRGAIVDLRVTVRGYGEPLVLSNALCVAGPRPVIGAVNLQLPSALPVALRPHELPAGTYLSAMLQVERTVGAPAVRLRCREGIDRSIDVAAGSELQGVRLQAVQPGRLFLSFDPGLWTTGCLLTASVQNPGDGSSDPAELGRVVRVPRIESFHLTDESAGENSYTGILTGEGLELIERTGWTPADGLPVSELPAPVAGDAQKQSLRIRMAWPSPAPHAPLFIWLRGETEGRSTTARP